MGLYSRELDDLEPFDVVWTLEQEVPDLGKHGAEEVILYLMRRDTPTFYINGKRATFFRPGDRISIITKSRRLALTILPSCGEFTGHITLASRSKHNPTDLSHYAVILKTLRRPSACEVRIRLQEDRSPCP